MWLIWQQTASEGNKGANKKANHTLEWLAFSSNIAYKRLLERRRPDSNRRSGFCRPLPYHLATSPCVAWLFGNAIASTPQIPLQLKFPLQLTGSKL